MLHKLLNSKLYKKLRDSIPDPIIDKDEEFKELYEFCRPFTMTSRVRLFTLYEATKYIIQNNIPGDFIECGVWKGGSSMLIAKYLESQSVHNRRVYLFDTFTGMPEPKEVDVSMSNSKTDALSIWKKKKNGWWVSSEEEVSKNMLLTGLKDSQFAIIKGKVEETIPSTLSDCSAASLVRLDTDWYESTAHELKYLYPLLSRQGVLIIDDYGSWGGAKKATDEYFNNTVLLQRIDRSSRLVIKN